MANKKGGLGRGLDALFADAAPIFDEEANVTENKEIAEKAEINIKNNDREESVVYIDINEIKANATQPRTNFNTERLQELAESIKENGIIQPLIVREKERGYEIVAGERRWRASRLAGIKKVPCLIRDFDDRQNMIVAIIENMQREDLNPVEEAKGLQQMINKYGFTQEQVSKSLGKSRPYIANSLRLLKLPNNILNSVDNNAISAAHGRTLINIENKEKQKEIFDRIVKEGLSVRATEKLAENAKQNKPRKKKISKQKSTDILTIEDELRSKIGTKVYINGDKSSGKIEVEYYSLEELNRIIDILRNITTE